MRHAALVTTILISVTAMGMGAALALCGQPGDLACNQEDKTGTAIAVDEKSRTVRILAGGKEIARIDADGLHVTGNVSYTGRMTDTGSGVQP